MNAVVLVKTGAGYPANLPQDLLRIEGVDEVWEATGDIDLLVKISAPDIESLTKIVFQIRSHPDVVETDTRMLLSIHKR